MARVEVVRFVPLPVKPLVAEVVLRLAPYEAEALERLLFGIPPKSYQFVNTAIYAPLELELLKAGLRTSHYGDLPDNGSLAMPLTK